MKSFHDYLSEKPILETKGAKPKVWHASKEEILSNWRNLRQTPIFMAPVPENQSGTRLKNDGIRVTGSPQFINSILSRIKDLLKYEDAPGTRLDVEYRQIEPDDSGYTIPAYLCYIHVEQDLKKKSSFKLDTDSIKPISEKLPKVKLAKPEI